MKKQILILSVIALGSSTLFAQSQMEIRRGMPPNERSSRQSWEFKTSEYTYIQDVLNVTGESYPIWNPAMSACPLHPTNAVELATKAISSSIPETKWRPASIKLETYHLGIADTHWFYNVNFLPADDSQESEKIPTPFSLQVGIDGQIPSIERFANQGIETNRAAIRMNLKRYQIIVIQNGHLSEPIKLPTSGLSLPEKRRRFGQSL